MQFCTKKLVANLPKQQMVSALSVQLRRIVKVCRPIAIQWKSYQDGRGLGWTGMDNKITADEADEAAPRIGEQIIVKTYTGSQAEATKSFQADAVRMADQGYFPVFQSWAPGRWRSGAFIAALLLCFLVVGIPALIYMLIVTPNGALTVTYGFRGCEGGL
jgi:hypothetical protein